MTRIAKLDYSKRDVRMYVTTPIEEQYRVNACAKEPWTVQWIESMPPGSVLYDIGACVGSYTLLAAAMGHTVVAIEPSFANYTRLCENVLLNDLGDKVTPLCLALGSHGGSCEVMEQELTPGYSGGSKRLRVPVLPLVDLPVIFGVPSPTHVKIDVDGTEAAVLEGSPGLAALSLMVEIGVNRNGTLGAYSRDRLTADPVLCTAAEGRRAIDWLTRNGYTAQQTFPGSGTTPVVWYGIFERASVLG